MRPPTRARPDARDTSYSVGPRCRSRRRRASHTRSFRRTNTQRGARRHRAWARPVSRSCYRWRIRVQAGTSGDAAARRRGVRVVASSRRSSSSRAAARRRSPALSAACCPPSAGRFRSPPVRSGVPASSVMRRASSRGRRRIGRLLACPAAGRPDRGDRSLPALVRGPARCSGSRLRGRRRRGLRTARRRLERGTRPGGSGERGRPPPPPPDTGERGCAAGLSSRAGGRAAARHRACAAARDRGRRTFRLALRRPLGGAPAPNGRRPASV
jgi:hypothetical protein